MLARLGRGFSRRVIVLAGDGIGPEITDATLRILDALKLPLQWEHHQIHTRGVTAQGDLISDETIRAIEECGFGLKGPFETPIGRGHRSLNVTLRKRLRLFANLRPCRSLPGVSNQLFDDVDLVTVRENTEGEYAGLEHMPVPGVAENVKVITKQASEAVVRFAFDFAVRNKRKRILCAHKASVMPKADGCFVAAARAAAKANPQIEYEEIEVDALCGRLISQPSKVDMMVMPNLYGDIVSDLCAGLVGGLGLTPSGNIGERCSVYEAVHGSAPDIAGQGIANPTALLLSAAMMVEHMGFVDEAKKVRAAIGRVIAEGRFVTRDLGGSTSTNDFAKAVIDSI